MFYTLSKIHHCAIITLESCKLEQEMNEVIFFVIINRCANRLKWKLKMNGRSSVFELQCSAQTAFFSLHARYSSNCRFDLKSKQLSENQNSLDTQRTGTERGKKRVHQADFINFNQAQVKMESVVPALCSVTESKNLQPDHYYPHQLLRRCFFFAFFLINDIITFT